MLAVDGGMTLSHLLEDTYLEVALLAQYRDADVERMRAYAEATPNTASGTSVSSSGHGDDMGTT